MPNEGKFGIYEVLDDRYGQLSNTVRRESKLTANLSFRIGIVRNPFGRDSHMSGHSPPCELAPVQSLNSMTAVSALVSELPLP